MVSRRGGHSAGDDDGLTRCIERNAKRSARSLDAKRTIRRRDVADDHGDFGAACLQGGQAHQRRPFGLTFGAAGSILSGGLGDVLKQLQQNGHGDTANSWVAPGPNKQISPGDLASALGADQINSLMSQSGLSRQELLDGLSQHLPEVVNHLTPDGRLPTENELADRL
jgi:uncharacterized protein YidB (DUF937 family)